MLFENFYCPDRAGFDLRRLAISVFSGGDAELAEAVVRSTSRCFADYRGNGSGGWFVVVLSCPADRAVRLKQEVMDVTPG